MNIYIYWDEYERLGSHSLLGKLSETDDGLLRAKEEGVYVFFQESTREELKKRPGPELLLMSELTPMCLIEDVMRLIQMEVKVYLGAFTVKK